MASEMACSSRQLAWVFYLGTPLQMALLGDRNSQFHIGHHARGNRGRCLDGVEWEA